MTGLQVYIDFKSANSYLAIGPTTQLAQSIDLEVDWLPFASKQKPVPIKHDNETKGERHSRIRAEYRVRVERQYAQRQNLTLNNAAYEAPSATNLALIGLALHPTLDYVNAAFDAYWVRQLDLDDVDIVNKLLVQTQAKEQLPDAPACAQLLDNLLHQASARGVIDAPTYAIDDELYLGREHLPWIRELILIA
jgi:2-hydroxychromene-2-carboxylate isomerase